HRDVVSPAIQVRSEPVEAVSGDRALVEGEEAAGAGCRARRDARRGERIEEVGADLNIAGVVSDREIRHYGRAAVDSDPNVHSGESGAGLGILVDADVGQKTNDHRGPDIQQISGAA